MCDDFMLNVSGDFKHINTTALEPLLRARVLRPELLSVEVQSPAATKFIASTPQRHEEWDCPRVLVAYKMWSTKSGTHDHQQIIRGAWNLQSQSNRLVYLKRYLGMSTSLSPTLHCLTSKTAQKSAAPNPPRPYPRPFYALIPSSLETSA